MKCLRIVYKHLLAGLTWRSVIAVTVAALAGVTFGRNVLGTVCVVKGASMAPNYAPGACLLSAPILTPLKRGDVVILDDGNEKYAVKRIVGLPGETLQIRHGQVFIYDYLLVEPYLPKHTYTFPLEGHRVAETITLKDGQYAVMGDNRICSRDSRTYGPVEEDQIKRRVPLPEGFVRAELAYTSPPASHPPVNR